jgi:Holliday junction resolvasome RuvABC endonuclease subunit
MNFLKNRNITIGVDLALNKTGLAILGDDKEILHTQLIKVTGGWEYYRKIGYLYETYLDLFNDILTAEPSSSILALEGRLKAGWSGSTLASIEGARVACYLAYKNSCQNHEKDVNFSTHDPGKVKQFIAGKRNANKEELLAKAVSQFSWVSEVEYQEDIYDAIYIALLHMSE